MAITYPRAMPSRVASVSFEPQDQTLQSPESGGRLVVVTLGPSRWIAQYQTARLREPALGEWRAWLASMRGGAKTFYATDPARLYPQSYPAGFGGMTRAGGGAFDGTATSWSVDGAQTALTLNGLPASFAVKRGDLIAFAWDTSKRYLTRALEDATANGSGVLAALEVWPRIESFVSAGAVATFAEPSCVMRIEPGSVSGVTQAGAFGQFSFRAVQHLEE